MTISLVHNKINRNLILKKIKYLALIPARSGSKGLPNKNLKLLNGKPMLFYTVRAALDCDKVSDIGISTDSENYLKYVRSLNINEEYVRPPELAGDASSVMDCILHYLNWYEDYNQTKVENLILLQPTSPLRGSSHLLGAINLYEKSRFEGLVSVVESPIHPYKIFTEKDGLLKPLVPLSQVSTNRQDYPVGKYFVPNGAIYIYNVNQLRQNKNLFYNVGYFSMDLDVSIDIDNIDDFEAAEKILAEIKKS